MGVRLLLGAGEWVGLVASSEVLGAFSSGLMVGLVLVFSIDNVSQGFSRL